ncbi:MAG: vanadium-dependent haloperoxidase [Flavobacteriales bacterium]|jgi:hypothetical protein|nr:vanadium-dependent haloperoxidase [Flavobacteriales bacterium]
MKFLVQILVVVFTGIVVNSYAQGPDKSVARIWMDTHLNAIKVDGLGPTVHARNLFHLSVVMFDAWAVYHPEKAEPFFLGKDWGEFHCDFDGFEPPQNIDSALAVTIHYAAYRLIHARFGEYSSKTRMMDDVDALFESQGLDPDYKAVDYKGGSPAALGNYLAEKIYEFGLEEPAGDTDGYEGNNYNPINLPLFPNRPGSQNLLYKNRWQPLSILEYIQQRGYDSTLLYWNQALIQEDTFLTPHWGEITPFAMDKENSQELKNEQGDVFRVYNDPGPPPYMSEQKDPLNSDAYKWNFALVAIWGGHNDPNDETMMDISPGKIGTTKGILPETYADYQAFFNFEEGGCKTIPHKKNPYTGKPYKENWVKRSDYSRVIAEYWVDGVNTMTPPGHWVNTLNEVVDHALFVRKWSGKGKELSPLEWDVKAYLTLCGGLHDAAISAWSIKAYYDYIRPISALRWMADQGQSSDSTLPRFHTEGIDLVEGKIELVMEDDPLVGEEQEHLHKIKLYSWNGPDSIADFDKDVAGAGWILAENWWPYQRYSFATPPFAGYVSGHSTFSAAAAEILTLITGDPFFPGGIAEHTFEKGRFLEFEYGPSETITLQWATYREAADETCLSRIWGGIHPPVDDIQGRKVGVKVGQDAYKLTQKLFKKKE